MHFKDFFEKQQNFLTRHFNLWQIWMFRQLEKNRFCLTTLFCAKTYSVLLSYFKNIKKHLSVIPCSRFPHVIGIVLIERSLFGKLTFAEKKLGPHTAVRYAPAAAWWDTLVLLLLWGQRGMKHLLHDVKVEHKARW